MPTLWDLKQYAEARAKSPAGKVREGLAAAKVALLDMDMAPPVRRLAMNSLLMVELALSYQEALEVHAAKKEATGADAPTEESCG